MKISKQKKLFSIEKRSVGDDLLFTANIILKNNKKSIINIKF